MINERWRLRGVRPLLDVIPEIHQEPQVSAKVFFRGALGSSAHDESAGGLTALVHQYPLEALALFVGGNLAADADVRDSGHENQKASGQRDVRGDARALLGDWLLGNLDQDLLARLQQIADDWKVSGLHRAPLWAPATVSAVRSSSRCATTMAPSSGAPIATLLAGICACCRAVGRLTVGRSFIFIFVEDFLFTVLLVEV